MSLVYVTTNRGKFLRVKQLGEKNNIDIEELWMDIDELEESKVEIVSKDKAIKAYEIVQKPVFVEDSGFYIDGFPNKKNYPGTLVKRSGVSSNIEKLLEDMKQVDNRFCYFISCVTYYDGDTLQQFKEYSNGYLSKEKRGNLPEEARSRLWEVFIPEGYTKTLAEMTKEERLLREKNNHSSFISVIEWYKENKMSKKYVKL